MQFCVTRAHEQIKVKFLLKPNQRIIKILGSNISLRKCTYLHCSLPQCVLFSLLYTCTSVHLLNHVFQQKEHATDIEGETQVPIFSRHIIHTTVVNPSEPIQQDEDPAETLLNQCFNWTKKLAATAGHSQLEGIKGIDLFHQPQGISLNNCCR